MFDRNFDAIQAGGIDSRQYEIRVRVRVAGAQLEAGCIRVAQITDEAGQDRTVTGRNRRLMSQGRYDADWCLEARFQAVQGIIRCGNERVDGLIVLEHAHDGTIANRAHEVFLLIIRREQVVQLAIFRDCSHTDMRMLAVASQTDHRFCLEADLEANGTEGLFDYRTDKDLVISGLQCIRKAPVNLELLTDMRRMTVLIDLGLEAADLFMAHLD